jgi:hypothetical protein
VWLAGELAPTPAKVPLGCSALEEYDAGMPLGRRWKFMPTKQLVLLQILVELAPPEMHITGRCSLGQSLIKGALHLLRHIERTTALYTIKIIPHRIGRLHLYWVLIWY